MSSWSSNVQARPSNFRARKKLYRNGRWLFLRNISPRFKGLLRAGLGPIISQAQIEGPNLDHFFVIRSYSHSSSRWNRLSPTGKDSNQAI